MENKHETVGEIAAHSLTAVRVFEKHQIDYCCSGKRPLADACRQKGLDVDLIRAELEAALGEPPAPDLDWANLPLDALIKHIVDAHHEYLRRELPAIQLRLDKVYRVYNQRYGPTLIGLPEVFAALRAELEPHLLKEERVLFPAIAAIDAARASGQGAPRFGFGAIGNPIGMMEAEHEEAGNCLRQIREITRDFAIPANACVTYKALMTSLLELEQDLHAHIHLENNILFPRAEEAVRSLAGESRALVAV